MKVVIAHRSGLPKVVDLPEPKAAKNFVTVRVSHTAMKLPEELHAIEQAPRRVPKGEDGYPLGSCASGTIIEVGPGVRTLKSGIRVAVTGTPYVYHAGQLVVPENLVVELPKKVNHEEGAFAGQGASALHLVRTAGVQLGEVVLILGADLLGLLTAQLVRAAGAIPILVDDSDFRLGKTKTIGIQHAFLPDDEQLIRTIDGLTAGHGVDSALLTRSGDLPAWKMATQLLRVGGTMALGTALNDMVPIHLLREKNLALRTAIGGGPGAGDRDLELFGAGYPRAIARWTERDNMDCFCHLLADRKVQVSPLVTDRIPIERATVAYEKASRGRDSVLGVVLTV